MGSVHALQVGLRFNVTPVFLNETTAPFIHHLADPTVKKLCNGQFLQDLLLILAEPKNNTAGVEKAYLSNKWSKFRLHKPTCHG